MTVDLLKGYSTNNKDKMPIDKWFKIQDRLRVNKEYKEQIEKIRKKVPNTKL